MEEEKDRRKHEMPKERDTKGIHQSTPKKEKVAYTTLVFLNNPRKKREWRWYSLYNPSDPLIAILNMEKRGSVQEKKRE